MAVRLEDEQILMTLQRKGDFVDLVSVDADSGKIPWIYKAKIVQACVAIGIGFELTYSKALFNSDCRRQVNILNHSRELNYKCRKCYGTDLTTI